MGQGPPYFGPTKRAGSQGGLRPPSEAFSQAFDGSRHSKFKIQNLEFRIGRRSAALVLSCALVHFELQEPALDGPVEERDLARRFEPDTLGQPRLAGENPRGRARRLVLEAVAESPVETEELVDLAHPLAVGRVGHDHPTGLPRQLEVECVPLLERDPPLHQRRLEVHPGRPQGPIGAVASDDGRGRLAVAVAGLALDLRKGQKIVDPPPLEGEFAVEPRRRPGRDEGGLDGKGAGAAHGIEQGLGSVVPGQQEDAGGQGLGQRCRPTPRPIATVRQGLTAGIEAEGYRPIFDQPEVEADVRVLPIDIRAAAAGRPQAIDDRVLDDLARKRRVAERPVFSDHFHCKGLAGLEDLVPCHRSCQIIEPLPVQNRSANQRHQNPHRGTETDVDVVDGPEIAGKQHRSPVGRHGLGPDGAQLVRQDALQTESAGRSQRLGLPKLYHTRTLHGCVLQDKRHGFDGADFRSIGWQRFQV